MNTDSDTFCSVPEGYFEKSYERTMAMAARARARRRRRLAAAGCLAALLLVAGGALGLRNARLQDEREDYLAEQRAVARLDIFFEIN